MIDIDKSSQIYTEIQQNFNETLLNRKIVKIERIQNKKLWQTYITQEQSQENKTQLNLYHGTNNTPPNYIYESQEGFGSVLSNSGMEGKAIYFAVNSQYSDNYSYRLNDNQKQMFYARVLIGNTSKMASDNKIATPLSPENSIETHDSVQGCTENSDVYMIYTSKKVYPEYLITYE